MLIFVAALTVLIISPVKVLEAVSESILIGLRLSSVLIESQVFAIGFSCIVPSPVELASVSRMQPSDLTRAVFGM